MKYMKINQKYENQLKNWIFYPKYEIHEKYTKT